MLYKSISSAPQEGDNPSGPGLNRSATQPARPEPSQVRQIASLRRGLATRQAAFRAARRRERSRRSKVAATAVPLLLLGSVAVPALAWAASGGGAGTPAASAASPSTGGVLTAFDSRPRPLGGDWAVQQPAALSVPAAKPATPATPAAPPTTAKAVVISAQGRSLGTFVVTCYDLQGRTASGATTSSITVAVDPRVIPLGTQIYIDGVGTRVAQDTGGAIIGKRLDIWEPTYAQCAAWGVETRQVWLG